MAAAAVGVIHETGTETRDKLPIYPAPTPDILLLSTPSTLETRIGEVRREVTHALGLAHGRVQGVVDRWIGVEEAVESRIKSFRDPTEPLTPGILYVGVSTLTASILTRSRALPTRFLLPPSLLLFSFAHFLPKTAANVGEYAEELEERFIPAFGEKRRIGVAHSQMGWERAKEGVLMGRERLGQGVEGLVKRVEEGTGLKVGQVVGWTQDKAKQEPKKGGDGEDKAQP
ncbi:apolipo protein O-domain-containing protein [Hygrophoropsis aurantiaca]|uniref:Apolipo protein O-domain-containing protein n=1 Tax=Hygrophoropsis aurantiaca TaxID=72124 RepID=A0ACB8A0W5_9AGAM|nr:apolipo protein O-domain-containing protein [Hygrophoropsis aurantiaca]